MNTMRTWLVIVTIGLLAMAAACAAMPESGDGGSVSGSADGFPSGHQH